MVFLKFFHKQGKELQRRSEIKKIVYLKMMEKLGGNMGKKIGKTALGSGVFPMAS